jgi:hypothetical protein
MLLMRIRLHTSLNAVCPVLHVTFSCRVPAGYLMPSETLCCGKKVTVLAPGRSLVSKVPRSPISSFNVVFTGEPSVSSQRN